MSSSLWIEAPGPSIQPNAEPVQPLQQVDPQDENDVDIFGIDEPVAPAPAQKKDRPESNYWKTSFVKSKNADAVGFTFSVPADQMFSFSDTMKTNPDIVFKTNGNDAQFRVHMKSETVDSDTTALFARYLATGLAAGKEQSGKVVVPHGRIKWLTGALNNYTVGVGHRAIYAALDYIAKSPGSGWDEKLANDRMKLEIERIYEAPELAFTKRMLTFLVPKMHEARDYIVKYLKQKQKPPRKDVYSWFRQAFGKSVVVYHKTHPVEIKGVGDHQLLAMTHAEEKERVERLFAEVDAFKIPNPPPRAQAQQTGSAMFAKVNHGASVKQGADGFEKTQQQKSTFPGKVPQGVSDAPQVSLSGPAVAVAGPRGSPLPKPSEAFQILDNGDTVAIGPFTVGINSGADLAGVPINVIDSATYSGGHVVVENRTDRAATVRLSFSRDSESGSYSPRDPTMLFCQYLLKYKRDVADPREVVFPHEAKELQWFRALLAKNIVGIDTMLIEASQILFDDRYNEDLVIQDLQEPSGVVMNWSEHKARKAVEQSEAYIAFCKHEQKKQRDGDDNYIRGQLRKKRMTREQASEYIETMRKQLDKTHSQEKERGIDVCTQLREILTMQLPKAYMGVVRLIEVRLDHQADGIQGDEYDKLAEWYTDTFRPPTVLLLPRRDVTALDRYRRDIDHISQVFLNESVQMNEMHGWDDEALRRHVADVNVLGLWEYINDSEIIERLSAIARSLTRQPNKSKTKKQNSRAKSKIKNRRPTPRYRKR
jgi:hypothetical protein